MSLMTNHEATTNTKRDDTLRRVQGLIDKAGSTDFPEERESLLAKADALMAAYAIEQFELDARGDRNDRQTPVVVDVAVSTANDRRVRVALDGVFRDLARHCDVMIGKGHAMAGADRVWKVVGYEADVRYLQMLYVSVQLHLVTEMDPSIVEGGTELENYALLRDAGIEVQEIFRRLGIPYFVAGYKPNGRRKTNDAAIRRLRTGYRRMLTAEGREYMEGAGGDTYRLNYLWAFKAQLRKRLAAMKAGRDEAATGHELAIIGRKEASQEVLWETWPELRPHPVDCECEDCHVVKCNDSSCSRPRCVAMRKPVPRSSYKEIPYDARAAGRGRRAADSANLSRGSVQGGSGGSLSS